MQALNAQQCERQLPIPNALVGGALCQIGKTCLDVVAFIAAAQQDMHFTIATDKVPVVYDTVKKMSDFLLELQQGTGKIVGHKYSVVPLTPRGGSNSHTSRWERIKQLSCNSRVAMVASFSSCSQLSSLQAVLHRWNLCNEPAMVLVDEVISIC